MSGNNIFIGIEPILPKPKDYPLNLDKAIRSAVREVLTTEVKAQLQAAQLKRTRLWRSKPYYTGQYRVLGDSLVLIMSISGSELAKNRWRWVSLGTNRSGYVTAKRAQAMVFRSYKAKTRKGNVYGIAGNPRRYGPRAYFPKPMRIPLSSIEPRHFEEHIIKEEEKSIKRKVKNAIEKAIKDS